MAPVAVEPPHHSSDTSERSAKLSIGDAAACSMNEEGTQFLGEAQPINGSSGVPNGTSKSPHKTLPASWMRDEKIFQLEKRAIFSKSWLLTSHTCKFSKPGEYISGNYIFDYIIIRDKDNNYQAFHNVCRHRAYPVVTKQSGSSLVLGCKYHGWSYNAKGDLIKAPKFDHVKGFEKSANGLFKIHTHVTPQGFIFLNFDSSPYPIPFEEHFPQLLHEWNDMEGDQYELYLSRQATGKFNWKTMMDGYQECYHCSVAHPNLSKALVLKDYEVTTLPNSTRHSAPKVSDPSEFQKFTFVFPTNGVTIMREMWYLMRTVPLNATETRMEFDYFGRKGMSKDELDELVQFFIEIQLEDFALCEGSAKGLNGGIYSQGELHPRWEEGVSFYQDRVLHYCEKHLAEERSAGREIHPALPQSQSSEVITESCLASRICDELNDGEALSW